jgi:hypothetical protein
LFKTPLPNSFLHLFGSTTVAHANPILTYTEVAVSAQGVLFATELGTIHAWTHLFDRLLGVLLFVSSFFPTFDTTSYVLLCVYSSALHLPTGWEYNTTGACEHMPSTVQAPTSVRALPCVEQDGMIWIWPGDKVPEAMLPDLSPPSGYTIHAQVRVQWRFDLVFCDNAELLSIRAY